MRNITFIVKPFHACNADCVYCSAYTEGVSKGKMKFSVIERLFDEIRNYHKNVESINRALFIWHGGEPLALKNDFYIRVLDLQDSIFQDLKIKTENSIQTNLLLLDSEKIELLKRMLIREDGIYGTVGTSIDPVEGIRVLPKGDYNKTWFEKVELLTSAGLKFGTVCVVHRHHLGMVEELFEFFSGLHEKYGAAARFNPLYASGKAKALGDEIHITPAEWGRFMVEFYRLWEASGKAGTFAPFHEYDTYHLSSEFSLSCEDAGTCSDNHLGIDTDGSVYQCGRAIDEDSLPYGSILNQSLNDILSSPNRLALKNRLVYLQNSTCQGCRWWRYCHGGCPSEAYNTNGTLAAKGGWCESRKMFFNAVYKEPKVHESRVPVINVYPGVQQTDTTQVLV